MEDENSLIYKYPLHAQTHLTSGLLLSSKGTDNFGRLKSQAVILLLKSVSHRTITQPSKATY